MTRKIIVPSKFNLDARFNSYNFLVLNLHAQNLSPILPDPGAPDLINPTQPARKNLAWPSDGLGTDRNIWHRSQNKKPIQPENCTQKCEVNRPKPDPTRPDHVIGRARANIFWSKPEVTRPKSDHTRRMIRSSWQHICTELFIRNVQHCIIICSSGLIVYSQTDMHLFAVVHMFELYQKND